MEASFAKYADGEKMEMRKKIDLLNIYMSASIYMHVIGVRNYLEYRIIFF